MASQEPRRSFRYRRVDLEQTLCSISERLKTPYKSSHVLMAFLRQKQAGKLGNCRRNMDGVIQAGHDYSTKRMTWDGKQYKIWRRLRCHPCRLTACFERFFGSFYGLTRIEQASL